MNQIKNPYNYDLTKFDTLMINENGEILGVANNINKFTKNEIIILPTGDKIRVLGKKKLIVVEEIKE